MTSKSTSSSRSDAASRKLITRINAAQKTVVAAKKVAKAAKAELKQAKKKWKETKRAAKVRRKELKALEVDLAALKAKAKAPRKPVRKLATVPAKSTADSVPGGPEEKPSPAVAMPAADSSTGIN